ASHGGEIHHQGNAGKILQNDARHHKRDLLVRRSLRVPIGQGFNILPPYLFPIAIAQHRFENDADTDWQPRDRAHALFFQGGKREERSFATLAGVELPQRLEFVVHFSSASVALILSKSGSAFASSLLSAY